MTASFRLTPRAENDLNAIARYTLEQWGREQRNSYLRSMDQRFHWLADNPNCGRTRSDVKKGYFSYPHGKHVIFYLVREGGIDIIGIPHQRMDVLNYFS